MLTPQPRNAQPFILGFIIIGMSKVDISLTLQSNQPSKDYMDMLSRVIDKDEGILKITVLPNWSYDFLMPPTGMVVEFNTDAKFKADLFFTDMWNGTSLAPVEVEDKTKLLNCHDLVLEALPQKTSSPPKFIKSDSASWNPSMSDRNSFIGLYSANRMNPKTQMIELKWFIIAHTGIDPQTYTDMELYFLKCEQEGKTVKEVFMKNPILEQFQALVVRNRRRLIHNFASATGVCIRSRKYTKGTTEIHIANEEFITNNNYVKFSHNNSKMLFFANATSTEDVHHGLIFHRAPLQGPLIFVGPLARLGTTLFNGSKWSNDENNAFPIGIGKHITPATWKQFSRIGISESSLSQKLILDTEASKSTQLLRYFPYRERNKEHRVTEEKLGYTFNNVVPVNPHIVRFL